MRQPWTGVGTALVTPFTPGGEVDEPKVRQLARRQIDGGVNFLVPCGTTGESPTLTHAEHLRVVELVLEEARGTVLAATTPTRWPTSPASSRTLACRASSR